ncbi:MAG: hypothetical protein LBS56_01855 [Propionibacteriaceae bacterium]|jgi:hypothetical protein|nr:hypothetical protein [Propionibacteriaceae bacterium]
MSDYSDLSLASAALGNPGLAPADLAAIAHSQPALRAQVAAHPAAYDGLLGWLDQVGDAQVKAAVAQRRGPGFGESAPTELFRPGASGAPDAWMSAPAQWSAAQPGQPLGVQAGAATATPLVSAYDPYAGGRDAGGGAVARSSAAPGRNRLIAFAAGGVVVVAALVVGGIALFKSGGVLGGAPELSEEQFVVLAEETLPGQADVDPLSVDLGSHEAGIMAEYCDTMSGDGILAEATGGNVGLTLFESKDQANEYIVGLKDCMSGEDELGLVESVGEAIDDVYVFELKILSVSMGQLAQYGNVVASTAFWGGSWESFATRDLKAAVDEAAKS